MTGHEQQSADGEVAADAGVGGTDGTGTDVIGSAVGAAGLSFVTFASGAAAAVVTYGLGRVFGTTIG